MDDYPLIIWERADGGITFTGAAPKLQLQDESEAVFLDRIAAITLSKHPGLAGATRLDDCLAPNLPHQAFRDCWRKKGTGKIIHVDMPLARTQKMSEIRTERDKRLKATDGLMAKANEIGASAEINSLKTMRQTLRDIPNDLLTGSALEAITIPKELDTFQPDWPENL